MRERTRMKGGSIDLVEGASAALVGGGIVTLALFPLALPLIALTVVALIPLLVIALAFGLVVAVLAAPLLAARWLRRRMGRPARWERAGNELGGPIATGGDRIVLS